MDFEYHIYGFFRVSQSLRKLGKSETFWICVSHLLQFKKFLKENDTAYNFCVFKYLRFMRSLFLIWWNNYENFWESTLYENAKKRNNNYANVHTKIGRTEINLYNYWKTSAAKAYWDKHKERSVFHENTHFRSVGENGKLAVII